MENLLGNSSQMEWNKEKDGKNGIRSKNYDSKQNFLSVDL